MPVISNPKAAFCKNHFVFQEDSILIKNKSSSGDEYLSYDSLPEEDFLYFFIKENSLSDWFSEPDLNYTAFMLKKEAPVPENFTLIPLRQFFWETKLPSCRNTSRGLFTDPFTSLFNAPEISSLAARAHSLLRLRNTYRFCPSCGTLLTDDKDFTAKKCPSCKKQIFPRIEPAIIVLVKRGEEILLVKNKNRSREFWSCVAGFVESGESIEQTVIREVKEETGLTVKNITYRGSQSWPFPDQLMLAFTAEYESGTIKIQEEELDDAAWFKKDSLPELPNPGSVAWNLIHVDF